MVTPAKLTEMVCLSYYQAMETVTLTKKEYDRLLKKALSYDYLRGLMAEDVFASPPVKNVKKVIKEFAATGKYNQKFLKSFEEGLKRSNYFNDENPAPV